MEYVNKKFNLDGRLALLTGGAGLLGQRYCRMLLGAGATVVVADVNEESAVRVAAESVDEMGGDARGMALNVADKQSIIALSNTLHAQYGSIDILINNAAIDPKFEKDSEQERSRTFEEYPMEMWQQSINVNLTGTFLCCQVIGAAMARNSGGVIVNVGSTYGLVAPNQSIYAKQGESHQTLFKPPDYPVTKAGVTHLTRYLAAYWGGRNVRVNTLVPGGVYNNNDPEFVKRYSAHTPIGRMADQDEMSSALLFLVSDASSYMTGASLVVDGGWTAW